MDKILTALEFRSVLDKLRGDLRSVNYNPDLNKMYMNIEKMVTELSKLEVLARRTHNTTMMASKNKDIDKAIDHLNKLIVMAKLMM